MTRDEIKAALQAGKTVSCGVWTWNGTTRNCWNEENCCYEYMETIEETLDDIAVYTDEYHKLEVLD